MSDDDDYDGPAGVLQRLYAQRAAVVAAVVPSPSGDSCDSYDRCDSCETPAKASPGLGCVTTVKTQSLDGGRQAVLESTEEEEEKGGGASDLAADEVVVGHRKFYTSRCKCNPAFVPQVRALICQPASHTVPGQITCTCTLRG
jgi:hypothetical protein